MEATALSVGKFVLDGALGYAKSAVAEEVALQLGIQRDHAFVREELEMMQAFLMVAHDERDEHKVIMTWVKQVRDVAYDAEDCLQDFSVHLHKPSWWHLPTTLRERHRIAKKMKELRARVEDVSQRNQRYQLIKGTGSKRAATADHPSIKAATIFGVDETAWRANADEGKHKVDLVQLITKDSTDLGVIAVWGRSGHLGNTSIIRIAFDDYKVKGRFRCRAWVKLMHPFNPCEFLRSLLRQFYEKEIGNEQEETATVGLEVMKKMMAQDNLVDEVNRYVTNESYLVVITDLSTVEDWDWIKTYFPKKKNGSRIILSTVQIDVPSLCMERPYKVSEIQQYSFNEPFYVFYKKVINSHLVIFSNEPN